LCTPSLFRSTHRPLPQPGSDRPLRRPEPLRIQWQPGHPRRPARPALHHHRAPVRAARRQLPPGRHGLRGPHGGTYEVYVHGTPYSVTAQDGYGRWYTMTPQELTYRISMAGNYDGSPIYLGACNTGRVENGFASGLAGHFGAGVSAPNETILVYGDGSQQII